MTREPDDLRPDGLLGDLGRSPAPPPDPQFVARTEERLRAVHATLGESAAPSTTATLAPRVRWRAVLPTLAGGLALLVAVLVATDAGPFDTEPESLRLVLASEATVTRADGTVVAATEGLALAEGDVVTTGANGRVVADGVDLGPSASAVVLEGRLRRLIDRGDAVGPLGSLLPPTRSVPVDPSPTSTTAPTRRDPPTTTTAPPDDGPRDAPASLRLMARVEQHFVGLVWTEHAGDRFAAYLVARSPAPGEPTRDNPDAQVVARITERDQTGFPDRPGPGTWRYRIYVVDGSGAVVATSDIVTVDVSAAEGGDQPPPPPRSSGDTTDR